MATTTQQTRLRTRHFIVSGALGGSVGFLLMEVLSKFYAGGDTRSGDLLHMALYFAGFGLAVGAALGLTEGFVAKDRFRLWYGLFIGLLLGAAGGFLGGGVGQTIYGLVPVRYATASNADIVIALDSSGSMSELFFFGNDPWGKRKDAAKELIDRLSSTDRVAVVDFDDGAQVLFPLTTLGSSIVREQAKSAVDQVDDSGGTDLDAGLGLSLRELAAADAKGRDRHVIFLTDGVGQYTSGSLSAESTKGIAIHTIGLGDGVDEALLRGIAEVSGGSYHAVADASDLIEVFERIFQQSIAMTTAEGAAPVEAERLTPPWVPVLLRVLSWGAMGFLIGAGQGVRENTREDVRACSLGGLLGGLVGGALFDPVTSLVALGQGVVGRGLADLVVGATIGGSMRIAQERLVEASGKPTTTLLEVLPKKPGLVVLGTTSQRAESTSIPVPPRPVPPEPVPSAKEQERVRAPLAAYEERYPTADQAMAMAYHDGYRLREVAGHFGVDVGSVRRAADQHPRPSEGFRRRGENT